MNWKTITLSGEFTKEKDFSLKKGEFILQDKQTGLFAAIGRRFGRFFGLRPSLSKVFQKLSKSIQKNQVKSRQDVDKLLVLRSVVIKRVQKFSRMGRFARFLSGHGNVEKSTYNLLQATDHEMYKLLTGQEKENYSREEEEQIEVLVSLLTKSTLEEAEEKKLLEGLQVMVSGESGEEKVQNQLKALADAGFSIAKYLRAKQLLVDAAKLSGPQKEFEGEELKSPEAEALKEKAHSLVREAAENGNQNAAIMLNIKQTKKVEQRHEEIDPELEAVLKASLEDKKIHQAEDAYLEKLKAEENFVVRDTPDDGDCLFAACLPDQTNKTPTDLRKKVYEHIGANMSNYRFGISNDVFTEADAYVKADQEERTRIASKLPPKLQEKFTETDPNELLDAIELWDSKGGLVPSYIEGMKSGQYYGGQGEWLALARVIGKPIRVYASIFGRAQDVLPEPDKELRYDRQQWVHLYYNPKRRHYERLIPIPANKFINRNGLTGIF